MPSAMNAFSTPDVETVVIGGGLVVLAIAAECAKEGQETHLLERHAAIGQETSSRSSEVVHAGIYYPPGPLKARLCVEGKSHLSTYAREKDVILQTPENLSSRPAPPTSPRSSQPHIVQSRTASMIFDIWSPARFGRLNQNSAP